MTVDEIYANTKILMFEKPSSTIYDNYLIPNLNRVLVELYEANNNERIWNGKAPFTEMVLVSTRQDEVPYEDIYCQLIIPLGLATYFEIDDDLAKYNLYNTDYQNARIMNQRLISQEMIDAVTTDTDI